MSTAAAAMTPIPKSTFVVSTAHCIFETLELCLHTALVCSLRLFCDIHLGLTSVSSRLLLLLLL
jgi:hypothetical protein